MARERTIHHQSCITVPPQAGEVARDQPLDHMRGQKRTQYLARGSLVVDLASPSVNDHGSDLRDMPPFGTHASSIRPTHQGPGKRLEPAAG